MHAVRSTPPGVAVVDVDEPDGPGELITIRSASICASDFGYIQFGSTFLLGHELAGVDRGRPGGRDRGHLRVRRVRPVPRGPVQPVRDHRHDGARDHGRRRDERVVPRAVPFTRRAARRARPGRRLPGGADGSGVARVPARRRGTGAAGGGRRRWRDRAHGGRGRPRRWARPRCRSRPRYPHQVELGERLGATATSGQYDVVIEAAGSESALHRCTELARPGGTMGVLGVFGPDTEWPQQQCFMKELRTVPALGYCRHAHGRDFDDAARTSSRRRPDLVDALSPTASRSRTRPRRSGSRPTSRPARSASSSNRRPKRRKRIGYPIRLSTLVE